MVECLFNCKASPAFLSLSHYIIYSFALLFKVPKKRRSKKNKSFEECLASLDDIDIPGTSSKKKPPVKFIDIETDCATGQQVPKNRKKYPRDKWKSKGKKSVAKEGLFVELFP